MIKKNIKKITSAILIGTLALCLFGCGGEKGEPKLSTVEEISAELDNMIDYEALGLEKVKDDFSESYVISKSSAVVEHEMSLYIDKILSSADEINVYMKTPDVATSECVFSPNLIYGEENGNIQCGIMTVMVFSHEYGMVEVEKTSISDGKNVISSLGTPISQNDDWSFCTNVEMLTELNGDLVELANSTENLKVRVSMGQFSTENTPDFELTKEQSDEFRQMLKWYIELKDKCDQNKVEFLL